MRVATIVALLVLAAPAEAKRSVRRPRECGAIGDDSTPACVARELGHGRSAVVYDRCEDGSVVGVLVWRGADGAVHISPASHEEACPASPADPEI